MSKLVCPVMLVETVSKVTDYRLGDFPKRLEPGNVLMCPPTHFTVKTVQNPFMEGKVGTVDTELAKKQWQALKEIYESIGCEVKTIDPVEDLEDMVFAANQVLPGLDDNGRPFVILGEMRNAKRNEEVPWYRRWFVANGYHVIDIDDAMVNEEYTPCFEGQGDAIWHPGRKLLWCAYGPRTDKQSATLLNSLLNVTVLQLKLNDARFYHLDTCFCTIDEDTVMIYEGAFDADGLALIGHFFKKVISVSENEALNFALNAVAINGNVILQKGSPQIVETLKKSGFTPIEVDTSEFMKSGGSVFCLKMMVY
ncbi:MAG: amidinotransferase [Candidatus Melainabacteria bacterium]|nr:amidinotransferase [Candidatus Melainabacteria bacterium]